MSVISVVNILDFADIVGEDSTNEILSDFSCPLNHEIEHFLQADALQFAKEKLAITYLVFGTDDKFIAYFTLTHKAVEICGKHLSNNIRRKLKKVSTYDSESDIFLTSAFLIAQFGKNMSVSEKVDGRELMRNTLSKLQEIQREIGGSIVYLECEKKPKLIDFYSSEENHFVPFRKRHDDKDNIDYLMMMRILRSGK